MVSELLGRDADLDAWDSGGWATLHFAAQHGNPENARLRSREHSRFGYLHKGGVDSLGIG